MLIQYHYVMSINQTFPFPFVSIFSFAKFHVHDLFSFDRIDLFGFHAIEFIVSFYACIHIYPIFMLKNKKITTKLKTLKALRLIYWQLWLKILNLCELWADSVDPNNYGEKKLNFLAPFHLYDWFNFGSLLWKLLEMIMHQAYFFSMFRLIFFCTELIVNSFQWNFFIKSWWNSVHQ